MKSKFRDMALAGATFCALALGGVAFAQGAQHVMRVALPGGGEAVIHYSGEKPDVTINAGPDTSLADELLREPLGWREPNVEAMFADMDRQFAAMRADMQRLGSATDAPIAIAAAPGSAWCSESVTITQEAGHKPEIQSRVAGSCAPAGPDHHNNSAHSAPAHEAVRA